MKAVELKPTSGMVPATDEMLRASGIRFNGISLKKDDVVVFPSYDDMQPHADKLGSSTVLVVKAELNGNMKWLPLGTFRRTPCDQHGDAFLAENSVNAELRECGNDFELRELLATKKLRVKEIKTSHKPYFKRDPETLKMVRARNADNSLATQPGDFAVFEWA